MADENEDDEDWQEDWNSDDDEEGQQDWSDDDDDDDDGPEEVWVDEEDWDEPEHLRQFHTECVQANQLAALQTLDLHPGLLNEPWGGDMFHVGDSGWVQRGGTAILAASAGGSEGLVVELLKRGADWKARNEGGQDALWLASRFGHVAVATVLLVSGGDPNTRSKVWTALGIAAYYDHLHVCILLISKGADLYAIDPLDGRTALQWYGQHSRPPLSRAVLEERRALLKHAYDEGPHPNARWARRWPFMQVMVFNDFQPLAARRAVLLALNPPLPPNVAIPAIPIGTQEQYRAYLHGLVFSHPGFWKLIASYI